MYVYSAVMYIMCVFRLCMHDVFGATCHKRPCTYVNFWVGVGGMLTFLALAHMLDATQDAGLGWGGC